MWVMTTRGFYSAVQHRTKPNKVLIRARCEEDIRALEEIVEIEPFRLDASDYEWRIEMDAADWVKALATLALDIDYDNFKTAVGKRQGHERSSVYMKVWSALLSLEAGRKKVWKSSHSGYPSGKYECDTCGDALYFNETTCWKSSCDGQQILSAEWAARS